MYSQSPKGTLIPIGGKEDKQDQRKILCRIIEETRISQPCVTIITLATSIPEQVEAGYRNAFEEIGVKDLGVIHYQMHGQADTLENLKKVNKCNVIMITGGDQLKLCSLLGGTKLLNLITERYYIEENFVIAGTSAGAAAMSTTMITAGRSNDAMLKGALQFTSGLGIIDRNIFIDTHFIQRGRLGRIVQIVASNPGIIGFGLAEDTAFVYKNGVIEVIGSGSVVVIDGSTIVYSDLTEVQDKMPITVQGMTMHVLGIGRKFSIVERKLLIENHEPNASIH
jgi:cyanophycinase